MYRIVEKPGASFGAVDTTEWWAGIGFFSQWAGDPPCPSGAILTPSSGCQYKGIIADKDGDPKRDKPLDQWIAEKCAEGEYVMMTEPYYDKFLKREAVRVLAGPGAPARTNLGESGTPPLTISACNGQQPVNGSTCPKGEFMTAEGCVPEGDLLAHMPPPCDDPEKIRAMFRDVGIPVAMPDSSYDKKQAAAIAILRWCQENEIDCRDDQAVCDALVKESSEAGVSTGVVVAIAAVGLAAAAGITYLATRKT